MNNGDIFNAQEIQNIHNLLSLYSRQLVIVKRDLARMDQVQAEMQEVSLIQSNNLHFL